LEEVVKELDVIVILKTQLVPFHVRDTFGYWAVYELGYIICVRQPVKGIGVKGDFITPAVLNVPYQ